jgi:hypothetical protein
LGKNIKFAGHWKSLKKDLTLPLSEGEGINK